MAHTTIKLRLKYDKLQALKEIVKHNCIDYKPENKHEHLLHTHMHALYEKLAIMVMKSQERFTINLQPAEALAFWQFFETINLSYDPYADLLIRGIIQNIHKASVNPLPKLRYGK